MHRGPVAVHHLLGPPISADPGLELHPLKHRFGPAESRCSINRASMEQNATESEREDEASSGATTHGYTNMHR